MCRRGTLTHYLRYPFVRTRTKRGVLKIRTKIKLGSQVTALQRTILFKLPIVRKLENWRRGSSIKTAPRTKSKPSTPNTTHRTYDKLHTNLLNKIFFRFNRPLVTYSFFAVILQRDETYECIRIHPSSILLLLLNKPIIIIFISSLTILTHQSKRRWRWKHNM